METSLILLVIVEIGAVKYMMSRQVCKRTNTLIKDKHSNSSAMRHAMRTKTRIDSRGSCGKLQLKTTCYDIGSVAPAVALDLNTPTIYMNAPIP